MASGVGLSPAAMNFVPPTFTPAPGALAAQGDDATALRWAALAEAGKLVAGLAGIEPAADDLRDVPRLIGEAEGWRRERAEAGVADLAAIMEPGLAALIAVNARGADPRPAAAALWHEFVAARAAVAALLAPDAPLAGRTA